MQYRVLGGSDLNVSRLCLGTMTYGQQNSESQAYEQLDYALSRGINFLDTAEMYPVPTAAETQGRTERYIGNWMKARNNRERLIVATKVAGPGDMVKYLREGIHLDRANIRTALTASLQRLQTDYIDLYQLHWPDRVSNYFGQLNYSHRPEQDGTAILETLQALKELVDEGLIRYIGLSNETPWGTMTFLKYAEMLALPRVVSVQNPYNLLNRSDEVGLSEVLLREGVDLLAYSPLAFGTLTGKYLEGDAAGNARLNLFPGYTRYLNEKGVQATAAYVALARKAGMNPAQMALAFINSRAFVGSTIVGATTLEQLAINIDAIDSPLSDALLAEIDALGVCYSNPCP